MPIIFLRDVVRNYFGESWGFGQVTLLAAKVFFVLSTMNQGLYNFGRRILFLLKLQHY